MDKLDLHAEVIPTGDISWGRGRDLSHNCLFNLGNSEIRFGAWDKKKKSVCSSACHPLTKQQNFHSAQFCSANQFGRIKQRCFFFRLIHYSFCGSHTLNPVRHLVYLTVGLSGQRGGSQVLICTTLAAGSHWWFFSSSLLNFTGFPGSFISVHSNNSYISWPNPVLASCM